ARCPAGRRGGEAGRGGVGDRQLARGAVCRGGETRRARSPAPGVAGRRHCGGRARGPRPPAADGEGPAAARDDRPGRARAAGGRRPSELVREAVLLGLAEAGGREIARPAMPALKDESVAVRAAAARAVAAGGDPTSSTVLIRRVEQEPDEGVQAELLRAIGRLGAREALDVLARYAEPGGVMHRRSATVRAAAVDGLRHIARPEARGLLELYSKDKEPAVRKAAEAALK